MPNPEQVLTQQENKDDLSQSIKLPLDALNQDQEYMEQVVEDWMAGLSEEQVKQLQKGELDLSEIESKLPPWVAMSVGRNTTVLWIWITPIFEKPIKNTSFTVFLSFENNIIARGVRVGVGVSKSVGKYDVDLTTGVFMGITPRPLPYLHPTIKKSPINRKDTWEHQVTFDSLYNRIDSLGKKLSNHTQIEKSELAITLKGKNVQEIYIDYEGEQPNKKITVWIIDGKKQIIVETEWKNEILQLQQQKQWWLVGTTDGVCSMMTNEEVSASIFQILNDRFDYVEEKIGESKKKTDNYLQSLAYQESQEKGNLPDDPGTLFG